MKLLIIILTTILLAITSCDTTDPKLPETKPPGYQEDIPWPSLADSPWPMYHHDPQRSGRSKYSGPMIGNILKKLPALNMEATPVILENNILCGTVSQPDTIFTYQNYETILWKQELDFSSHTTPVVDSDNNIYVTSESSLYKFSHTGEIIWKSELQSNSGVLSSSLTLDKTGNIYLIQGDFTLYVYDKDGNYIWSFHEPRLFKNTFHVPSFSPDGKTIYLQGETVSLIALDIESQTIEWEFGEYRLASAPIVDSQGNIYLMPSTNNKAFLILFSLSSNGDIRWRHKLYSDDFTSEEPSIDKNGNIIFGLGDTLYSFNYEGIINWKTFLGYRAAPSSTVSDLNGNIFLTLWDPNKVVAFNNNGQQIWEVIIDDERLLYPPLLTSDSKLVVPSFRSNHIYIIE